MASGHVNRKQRPNTWLLRPGLRREESPCQRGAVHTWHEIPVAPNGKFRERNGRPSLISGREDTDFAWEAHAERGRTGSRVLDCARGCGRGVEPIIPCRLQLPARWGSCRWAGGFTCASASAW